MKILYFTHDFSVPERYRESYPIYDLKTGSLTVPQQPVKQP